MKERLGSTEKRRFPTQCCHFSVDQPIDSEHRLADIVACYEQQAILRNATHFSTRLSEEAADAPCEGLRKPGQVAFTQQNRSEPSGRST